MGEDKKYKIPTNLCAGVFSLVFGLIVIMLIPSQIKSMEQSGITSGTIPYALAGIMVVIGIWLLFQRFVLKKEDYTEIELSVEKRRLIYLGGLVLYAFIIEYIGFLVSSLLIGAFTLWYMEDKKPMHYVSAGISIAVIYLVFRFALGIDFVSVVGV